MTRICARGRAAGNTDDAMVGSIGTEEGGGRAFPSGGLARVGDGGA